MVLTWEYRTESWKEQTLDGIFGPPTQNNPEASDGTNLLGPAGVWGLFVKSALCIATKTRTKAMGMKAEDPRGLHQFLEN